MSVLVDVQALQSVGHGERGIARYVSETAVRSLQQRPDLVAGLALNPDLPYPATIEPLVAAGAVLGEPDWGAGPQAYHVASPFELAVPLERLWPRRWRRPGTGLLVTLYDLIPLLFNEHYLRAPEIRAAYEARRRLVQAADLVLCISEATARDAARLLQVPDDRLRVVHAGVAEHFTPPRSRGEAAEQAVSRVPGLRKGYLLYTGGIDHRKNVDGLLVAYAALPERIRRAHQLAIVCAVRSVDKDHYEKVCARLGVREHVVFTGFVPDDLLVLLYQGTRLFVFPSLYEGFGLPVVEALACGAEVVVGDNSSLVELVPEPDRRFPAEDPAALTALLSRLLSAAPAPTTCEVPPHYTWDAVATATCDAYEEVLARSTRRLPRGRRVAVVSPVPPARTGIADYTDRLVRAMREEGVSVDLVADSASTGGDPRWTARDVLERELRHGPYDGVLYCVGNSEHHHGALSALLRRPGTMLLHDVRLEGLHRTGLSASDPGVVALCRDALARIEGRPPASAPNVERFDVLGVVDLVTRATSTLVHSRFAADLVRLGAGPDLAGAVRQVPFGVPAVRPAAARSEQPVLASFGIVHRSKQSEKVLEAFLHLGRRRPTWRFVLVGPVDRALQPELERLMSGASAPNVAVLGDVPDADYRAWLSRAHVAVQLRDITNGESSAAVADCMAAGLPTVVTALGAARELPEDAVVHVPRRIAAAELADVLEELVLDEDRRGARSASALEHGARSSFRAAAREVLQAVLVDGSGS